jgi:hypothetical protein
MLLREIAHTRTGDKGNRSTISVIAYQRQDFERLRQAVTVERLREHYRDIVRGDIERFELPQLGALSFVLHDSLGGGVTRSLALDAHGKCLGSSLLSLEI